MTNLSRPAQAFSVAAGHKPVVRLRSARCWRQPLAWALAFTVMGTALAQPTPSTPTSTRQLDENALTCARSIQMTLMLAVKTRVNHEQSATGIDKNALKTSDGCNWSDIEDVSSKDYPSFVVKNKMGEKLYTVQSSVIYAMQPTVKEVAGNTRAFDLMALECIKSVQSALSSMHQRSHTYPSVINKVIDGVGTFCTPAQISVVGMSTQNSYTFTVHDSRGATIYTATPDLVTASSGR